ncbi:hypothetical protein Bpfe_006930 [Biomphalaria pfeifferi]|uniref:Uncharacterized protein n=1 Tax=Biomphalaria pfeifferi TaxID=112525 RepID=A0AAD8BZK8_BIOPF|nr:hypothetical protein Bpfe_006930 [Biomphalaria pfeifferi]
MKPVASESKLPQRAASPESSGYFSENEASNENSSIQKISYVKRQSQKAITISSFPDTSFHLPDLSLPPPSLNESSKFPATNIFSLNALYTQWFNFLYTSQARQYVMINMGSTSPAQSHVIKCHMTLPRNKNLENASPSDSEIDSLKMSPCLRSPGAPCADDLGNYAMHVNQYVSFIAFILIGHLLDGLSG